MPTQIQHIAPRKKAPLLEAKWRVVIVLFFTAGLNYADRAAVSSVFPLLRTSLHLSDYALAGIGTVFLWSYAFGSPFAGSIADRKRRSSVLITSLICWSLVMMATSLSRGAHSLLFLRGLLGIAECAYLPAAYSLLSDHHGRDTKATAVGIHICGMNVGVVGGSTLAAALGEHIGWRSDFVVLGAIGLVLAAVCALVITEGPLRQHSASQRKPLFASMGALFTKPVYLWIVAASMLIAVVMWSLLNWLPLFFHEHFRLGLTASGFTSSASMQSAAIIGAFSGGLLSDKLAHTDVRRRITLLIFTRLVAAPALLAFLLPLPIKAICALIFAYSLSIQLGAGGEVAAICEAVEEEQQATALGIFNLANSVAGGAGILGTIFLQHCFGWTTAIACLALVVLLASCCLVMARRSGRMLSAITVEIAPELN
jgi:predicted MFS family arabinose efflux permease